MSAVRCTRCEACVLGAAPVAALSYGFWTFTQRAAATRRDSRHWASDGLWQTLAMPLFDALWATLPTPRNGSCHIRWWTAQTCPDYVRLSLAREFWSGVMMSHAGICRAILNFTSAKETDFYPAQRLGLLGLVTPVDITETSWNRMVSPAVGLFGVDSWTVMEGSAGRWRAHFFNCFVPWGWCSKLRSLVEASALHFAHRPLDALAIAVKSSSRQIAEVWVPWLLAYLASPA